MENEFLDLAGILKAHELSFKLVPAHLTGFSSKVTLGWEAVRFVPANANAVPNRKGVYAFVVEEPGKGLPPHGYVMYVGKAGDGAHSLRKRFQNYLQDQKRPRRPNIYHLLNRWRGVLSFYYAEIENATIQLTEVETALNDALVPPFNKKDFSATFRRAINAFGN